MLVEIHFVVGSSPTLRAQSDCSSVGRAHAISPSLVAGPEIIPGECWLELHCGCRGRGFESHSCYHGGIAQRIERVMFHPFLVARDQNSGISSGWLECRTWTAEVGGSNPPSLTKLNRRNACGTTSVESAFESRRTRRERIWGKRLTITCLPPKIYSAVAQW